jgi:hypothetical protein
MCHAKETYLCDRRTTHCDYHCFRHESCLPPHRLHERRRNTESLLHRSLFALGQGKRNARSERLRISPDHHSIGHLTTGRVISSSSDSASASVVACHPRAAPPAARASTISSSMLKGTCIFSSSCSFLPVFCFLAFDSSSRCCCTNAVTVRRVSISSWA